MLGGDHPSDNPPNLGDILALGLRHLGLVCCLPEVLDQLWKLDSTVPYRFASLTSCDLMFDRRNCDVTSAPHCDHGMIAMKPHSLRDLPFVVTCWSVQDELARSANHRDMHLELEEMGLLKTGQCLRTNKLIHAST